MSLSLDYFTGGYEPFNHTFLLSGFDSNRLEIWGSLLEILKNDFGPGVFLGVFSHNPKNATQPRWAFLDGKIYIRTDEDAVRFKLKANPAIK